MLGAALALGRELLLNRVKELGVDISRVFAGPGVSFVIDLADVIAVPQNVGGRTVGEMYAARGFAGSRIPDPAADAP